MTHEIIERRYEATRDGRIIIDICIDSINDLYNNFDKITVFSKRELDQDFVDYLIESANEIKEYGFIIRISIDQPVVEEQNTKIRKSIRNYFIYLKETEAVNVRKNIKRAASLFVFGFLLIAISVFGTFENGSSAGILKKMLQEGIVIAAWVSVWEALASAIFEWNPYFKKIRLYKQIIAADIEVLSTPKKSSVS